MDAVSAAACAGSASGAVRRLALLSCLGAGLLSIAVATASPSPASADSSKEQSLLKLQQGRTALLRGQHRTAVALLTDAIFSGLLSADTRAFALGHRGLARSYLGELRPALHDFNAAIDLSPEDPTLYNNRGNLLLHIGLFTEAAKDFDQAISLAPDYGAALNNRGNTLILQGDYVDAIADFGKAIDLMPLNAAPFNGRGKAQLALGRPAGAMRDFSRAIGLSNRYARAYVNRAEALIAIHRYQEAIGDYGAAIGLGAGTAQLYRARAALYAALEMQGPALADLAAARKLDPASVIEAETSPLSKEAALAALAVPAASPALPDPGCTEPTASIDRPGLAKVADAIGDARPVQLLYQSASTQLDGHPDPAAIAYRTALNCAARSEADREPLAQLASAVEDDTHALAALAWRLERRRDGAYVASHPEHPELSLRLEMYGLGEPELLHWQELGDPLDGIGLLHYRAGVSSEGDGLEYVAVIDMDGARLLAIEPASWGKKRATWSWSETELIVVDPQGVPSRVLLDGQMSNKLEIDDRDHTVRWIKRPSGTYGQVAKGPRPRALASSRAKKSRRASQGDYDHFNYRRRVPQRFNAYNLRYPGAYASRRYR